MTADQEKAPASQPPDEPTDEPSGTAHDSPHGNRWVLLVIFIIILIVLLFGLWNMMRGGSPNRSQKLMRLRVLLQFVALVVIMVTIWAMGR